MWLRLRQIALVAEELAPAEAELEDVLGIAICYRDPGVAHFGLENALLPIGNQLLEVVAPIRENTAGGRYLARRGGNGGYMVITQCDDHAPRRARVEALGVRVVTEFESSEFRNMQLHPRDTGGSFLEIDEQVGPNAHDPDGPWEPAGPNRPAARPRHRHRGRGDPVRRPRAGGRALVGDHRDPRPRGGRAPDRDGRPEGLGGIDVTTADRAAILAAAEARGVRSGDDQVHLCGMRIHLR
jgi:hypothetical protein